MEKPRTRLNAITHGIFAKLILPEEKTLARRLLEGFRRDFQPASAMEEAEVGNLVMNCLRRCRVDRYERTGIENARRGAALEFAKKLDAHRAQRYLRMLGTAGEVSPEPCGALRPRDRVDLLEDLLIGLSDGELDTEKLLRIIDRAYGNQKSSFAAYIVALTQAARGFQTLSAEERAKFGGLKDVDSFKKVILLCLSFDIDFQKAQTLQEEAFESQILSDDAAPLLPDPQLDRVLRYRAALERDVDRILERFERIRQLRVSKLAGTQPES